MVVVQVGTKSPRPVENIKTNELQPYRSNKTDLYVAAYLNVEQVAPSTFVVGNGENYKLNDKNYFNKPLKQNSSYRVFLRFFENEVNFI